MKNAVEDPPAPALMIATVSEALYHGFLNLWSTHCPGFQTTARMAVGTVGSTPAPFPQPQECALSNACCGLSEDRVRSTPDLVDRNVEQGGGLVTFVGLELGLVVDDAYRGGGGE